MLNTDFLLVLQINKRNILMQLIIIIQLKLLNYKRTNSTTHHDLGG